jgi:hypothetical protein
VQKSGLHGNCFEIKHAADFNPDQSSGRDDIGAVFCTQGWLSASTA